jgi:Flp pilus assembly protein TadD
MLNVVLAYLLVRRTLLLPSMAARYGTAARAIAWVAAAAFAVHPLATESVAYISSRSEVLSAFFMLLALYSYVLAVTAPGRRTRRLATIAVPFFVAAALGSKEIALTTPLLLLIYDWCFLAEGRVRSDFGKTAAIAAASGALAGVVAFLAASQTGMAADSSGSIAVRVAAMVAVGVGFCRVVLVPSRRWKLIALSCAPFALGAAYFLYRYLSPTGLGDYGSSAGLTFERFGWPAYFMTQLGVIVHYLRLVIVPTGLNFDYDWPLQKSFASPAVILPLVFLIALAAVAFARVRQQPVLTFAVLGMLALLAPTSSLLPLADIVVEHRMYLALVGLLFLAATLFWDLLRRLGTTLIAGSAVATLITFACVPLAVLAVVCRARATLWADAIALHEDAAAKALGNPRVRLNLGVTYMNMQKLPEAEKNLAEAKRLYDLGESVHAFDRIGAFIYYNLGAVQYLRGEIHQAPANLEKSLEMGGQYLALRPMALYILARIAFADKQYETAVKRFTEALRYNKFNPGWYVELAGAQVQWGRPGMARTTLQQAAKMYPDNQQIEAAIKAMPTPRPLERKQVEKANQQK